MSATHKSVRTADDKASCRIVAEMLSRIGDKWTVLVVGTLSAGTMRYTDLHRNVDGISQRMLTLTLRGLEEDGLVARTVYPTIPPRVEYTLTPMGHTLTKPLFALYEWTMQHRPGMLEARKAFARGRRRSSSSFTASVEMSGSPVAPLVK